MKKILIVGGTGVISTEVTKEALRQGVDVYIVNRGNRKNLIPRSIKLIKSDKDDYDNIASSIGCLSFDAVIDFLCFTKEQIERSFLFYKNYTKQYFFISTCCVYDAFQGIINDEESPKVTPVWKYSVDKWAAEKTLVHLAELSNVNYTIIRPCVTYGNTRFPYGISPKYGYHWTLVARILNEKPIITWNGGTNRCNMMRVEDFAVALINLIGNTMAYNQAFNICGDETPTFMNVLEELSELVGKQVITVDIDPNFYASHLQEKSGEILGGRAVDSLNSNSKVKAAVPSFKQRLFLKEGMRNTYEAYKNNDYLQGIDWDFDGNTDRVIYNWCKYKGIDHRLYRLHFVDYLNKNSKKDLIEYLFARYRDSVIIKGLKNLKRVMKVKTH